MMLYTFAFDLTPCSDWQIGRPFFPSFSAQCFETDSIPRQYLASCQVMRGRYQFRSSLGIQCSNGFALLKSFLRNEAKILVFS